MLGTNHEFGGYGHHHQPTSFNDVLMEQLRNTPWFLISLGVHVVILVILNYFGTTGGERQEHKILQASIPETQMPVEELPPVEQETEEIKPEDKVTEDPVVKDTEVADHTETDDDSPFNETMGEENALSDKPFDGVSAVDAIGLGPGGGSKFGKGRGGKKNLKAGEISQKTEAAVTAGLEWLANHQSKDGRWDCDAFMNNGDPAKGPLCDGRGQATNDVGVTGLALLCFLGAGHTHKDGDYRKTVRNGLLYLKEEQDGEGCFGPQHGDQHWIYNHGIAALAMAEAYGMTQSVTWRAPAQSGINFVMECQNPYKAWRYGKRPSDDDVSVTGWMVMALKSAKGAGLDINDNAIQWALDFVNEMTDQETGRTGYRERGEIPVRLPNLAEQFPASESESLTAVGMLVRVFAGEDPAQSEMIKAGAELIAKRLPVWNDAAVKGGKVDMYYWYYATLVMHQVGGAEWTAWNNRMKEAIIDRQRQDGNFNGSWDAVGPWGGEGGRVYSTALMTLCMEVYYRYERMFGGK